MPSFNHTVSSTNHGVWLLTELLFGSVNSDYCNKFESTQTNPCVSLKTLVLFQMKRFKFTILIISEKNNACLTDVLESTYLVRLPLSVGIRLHN